MTKKIKQSVGGEFIKYGVVGAVSTAIDMVVLNVLKRSFDWALWIPVALGFLAGTINGYYLNSRWTFKYNTEGQEAKKFTQFATISAIGLGLTEIIVNGYVHYVGAGLALVGMNISSYNTGKLLAVVLVFFWNFIANKLWTFKKS